MFMYICCVLDCNIHKLGHAGTILGISQVSRMGTVPRNNSKYSGKTSYHVAVGVGLFCFL